MALACFLTPHAKAQDFSSPYATPPQYNDSNIAPSEEKTAPENIATDIIAPLQPDDETATTDTPQPVSRIEAIYSRRAGEDLQQFGYDLFSQNTDGQTQENQKAMPIGAVQDDFVLNVGDTLRITFTGQHSETLDAKIDTQGMLLIPDMMPVAAVGLTIRQLRERLQDEAQETHNTQIHVSLASVQQIGVLLIGRVKQPGRYNLTVFNTVIDALEHAGGVRKDGSLRDIKLVRAGRSTIIDLYTLLNGNTPAADLRLRDGDRLIVPPLGHTLAVAGAVKQPGIFELPTAPTASFSRNNATDKHSLNQLLGIAGGILQEGNNRFLRLSLQTDGRETTEEISNRTLPLFGDGDILLIEHGQEKRENMIEVIGATPQAGLHDESQAKTLTRLFPSETTIQNNTYPLLGIIERHDPEQITTRFISFPIRSVLKKQYNLSLHSEDKIYIFKKQDISKEFQDITNDTDRQQNTKNNATIPPEILSFMKEQTIAIRGGVRTPGTYPIAEGNTLENIIAVAGGLSQDADKSRIEITSTHNPQNEQDDFSTRSRRTIYDLNKTDPATIPVHIGDAVRINLQSRQIEEKTVFISGEVKSPGRYEILAGDHLSTLLARAGGLSAQAYPAGTIFSRESERRAEETRFRNAAKDLERSLAAAMQNDKKAPNTEQIEMVRGLASELSTVQAVGRITVESNPAILSEHPELDILLEPGDKIYIPKRPLTVRVSGEVLSPASLQFRKGKDPLDYIDEAGGFTFHADKGRSFVLFPDGSAQPLKVSPWNHTPIFIPPGSTIVVPRDPKPFDFIERARDFTQILSNLAVTSIFIDDLRN